VAATGRLSSSDPNLQNIPIRTAEGRRIRQAFIAPPGFKLLAADYSQIELRIMAHLSGDEGLLAAFASDEDVHRATASEVFNTPLAEVTGDHRRSAKAINFGLIYGMSAFGLAKQLGLDRGQAQAYVDRYFERYPGVRRYMDQTRESARRLGYVTTVFGRRLYLPEINARNARPADPSTTGTARWCNRAPATKSTTSPVASRTVAAPKSGSASSSAAARASTPTGFMNPMKLSRSSSASMSWRAGGRRSSV
jgi:DNA polymerase I-like protein with 3'-5' exonuclease and polymerase domains